MKQTGLQGKEGEGLSARAVSRYLRISPRKVRLVLDAIRRKPVSEAFAALTQLNKKGARVVIKVLKSAVANAKKKEMDEDRLFVRLAFADGGPTMKRYLPRAMGRADTIIKRTSHITVVVEQGPEKISGVVKGKEEKGSKAQKPAKQKSESKKEAAAV